VSLGTLQAPIAPEGEIAMLITTSSGAVRTYVHDGVIEALGIPYASARRLAAPTPVGSWREPLDARAFGPASLQPPGEVFLAVDMPQSEDCLSLNVWAPVDAREDRTPRPVMVWIHGGGFRQGSGAHMLSQGPVLAARGEVVVVTLNYRLGALGFLSHPDLADDNGVAGNWAILDLLTALRWVRDEIGAFGGDGGNVTLFGESAGGTLVWLLAASADAHGLFRRVIVQSGVPSATDTPRAARVAEELADELGAPDVRALRDRPGPEILAAQVALEKRRGGRMVFMPCVDGTVVERAPLDALAAGAAAGLPMMIGTNVDEMRLLGAGDSHRLDLDDDGLRRRLEKVLEGDVEEVIRTVRRARSERGEPVTPSDLWFAIETDRFFRVPSLRAADAHVAHEPRTFVYLFAWRSPALDGWLGACHVLEIPFVFGCYGAPHLAAFAGSGAAAETLSAHMMAAWVAFARTDDPSTPDLPWPAHDADTRPTMVFDATLRVEKAPRDAERAVIAARWAPF
jgi:para-nitrobenzyl esterase